MEKILVIGACGQIGVELTLALRKIHGNENVFASDIREENQILKGTGPFIVMDALNADEVRSFVKNHSITTVYLLAALLSATGEKNPKLCWDLNMESLRQLLDLGVEEKLKIFWPSSIAIFGATTPKDMTPQKTVIEPTTMYGITKYAGELLCQYYNKRFGLDVRSVRYPGLISWKTPPGGGTTDYAVEIFYEAIKNAKYTSFLSENTYLPMMYMDDAIRATIEIMEVPNEKIKSHMSYNLSAISFSPKEIGEEIKKHIPGFELSYNPDHRQAIADSWPASIDDSVARSDWGWKHEYDLVKMTEVMLTNLKEKLQADQSFKVRRYDQNEKNAVFNLYSKALVESESASGNGEWDEDFKDIEATYIKSGGEFLVGIISGRVVAAGALRKLDDNKAEIKRLRVDPEFQRRGFGQTILSSLESRAKELGFSSLQLDTSIVQEAASKLYEKNGYQEYDRRLIGGLGYIFYKKNI